MFPDKNYTLGRSKLWFNQFAAGTKVGKGQRYFGNTPEINMTSESENLDHYDSDNGVRVKDDSVVLESNRTGTFITDHISPENLALFFLGESSVLTQSSALAVTYAIVDVQKNRRYQIGASSANPAGVRGLANVVVKVGAVTKTLGTDYTVDVNTGGLVILSGGTILVNDDVDVTYDLLATSYNRIITNSGATALYGSLFVESTNPKGERFDYFFPYVAIRPDGDFALKSDEWQQLPFSLEVLKLDDSTESVYINGRPGSGV